MFTERNQTESRGAAYLLASLETLHGITWPDISAPKPDSDVVSALVAMQEPGFDSDATLTALKAEEWEERLQKRRVDIDAEMEVETEMAKWRIRCG